MPKLAEESLEEPNLQTEKIDDVTCLRSKQIEAIQ